MTTKKCLTRVVTYGKITNDETHRKSKLAFKRLTAVIEKKNQRNQNVIDDMLSFLRQ